MKFSVPVRWMALATASLVSLAPLSRVESASFEETDIDQNEVIAVARPYGENKFDFFIIQQIPGKNKCWEEKGTNPIIVEPLLLNFNFSGHCNRATDSNGYSVRIDGQDYGLDLLLRLVQRNGELVLVAAPRKGVGSEVVVGRTSGLTRDFMKIILDPGWKYTKRAYEKKVLGHFYFSGNQTEMTAGSTQTPESQPLSPSEVILSPEKMEKLELIPTPEEMEKPTELPVQ